MEKVIIFLFIFIGIFNGGKNLIAEIFFAFVIPLIFLKEFLPRKNFFSHTLLNLPLFIFLILSFFSIGISVCPKATLDIFLQIINYLLFFYFLLYSLRENKNFDKRILQTIVFLGVFFSLWGIIQFFQGKTVMAILPNGNLLAGFLVPSSGIILSRLSFDSELSKREKISNFILLFLFVFTLLITRSRGGYLSLILMFTLLLFLKYRRLSLTLIPIMILLLFFIFLPQKYLHKEAITSLLKINDPYSFTRLNIWFSAWKATVEKPLFGWGLGTFKTIFFRYNFPVEGTIARYGKYPGFAMNEYLQILAELGFSGFFCLIWLFYLFFKEIYQTIKKEEVFTSEVTTSPITWQLNAILLGSTAILTHALVDFNLHLPLVNLTLISFIAIGVDKSSKPFFLPKKVRFFLVFLVTLLIFMNFSNFLSQHYYKRAKKLTTDSEEIINLYKKAILLNLLDSLPHQSLGDLYAEKYILTDTQSAKEKYKENTIKEYKKAVKLESENAFIYRSLGGFYYDYTEHKDLGIANYEKAIKKNPYNAFFHFELGKIYLNGNCFFKAKESFKKTRELEPNYLQAYFEEGLLWEKERNEDKALELYSKILEIDEKNLVPSTKYEKKLLQFEYVLLYNQLAEIYFRKGAYEMAANYCKKGLTLEPSNETFKKNLALCLKRGKQIKMKK